MMAIGGALGIEEAGGRKWPICVKHTAIAEHRQYRPAQAASLDRPNVATRKIVVGDWEIAFCRQRFASVTANIQRAGYEDI
jgi:hypothetical protein